MAKAKRPRIIKPKYTTENCCGGKKGSRSEVTLLPQMKLAA